MRWTSISPLLLAVVACASGDPGAEWKKGDMQRVCATIRQVEDTHPFCGSSSRGCRDPAADVITIPKFKGDYGPKDQETECILGHEMTHELGFRHD